MFHQLLKKVKLLAKNTDKIQRKIISAYNNFTFFRKVVLSPIFKVFSCLLLVLFISFYKLS